MSLRYIQENGGGAVLYLQQEGRGIGLANKVAAYALQVSSFSTGFDMPWFHGERTFSQRL